MMLAFDTFYYADEAKTVCISFTDWSQETEAQVFSKITKHPNSYQPGEFYKRELPCILDLCKDLPLEKINTMIVDGYVYLDDDGKLGLGGRLYQHFNKEIPVIGVAKSNFFSLQENQKLVYRGKSKNPLYITAAGISLAQAAHKIQMMHGNFRIPTLLKRLDLLTRIP